MFAHFQVIRSKVKVTFEKTFNQNLGTLTITYCSITDFSGTYTSGQKVKANVENMIKL